MTTMAIGRLKQLEFQEYALAIVVVLLFVAGAILEPDTFPTWDNVRNMLTQASVIGVLAMGMTFVIATAGIDLSVGSMVAAAGVFGGVMLGDDRHEHPRLHRWRRSPSRPLLGSINAVAVAYGRVVPFIATLAMFSIGRGLALLLNDKLPVSLLDLNGGSFGDPAVGSLLWFGNGRILGIPVSVYVFLAITIARLDPAEPHALRALRGGGGRQPRGGAHRRRAGAARSSSASTSCRGSWRASRPCCCARASAAPRR